MYRGSYLIRITRDELSYLSNFINVTLLLKHKKEEEKKRERVEKSQGWVNKSRESSE